MAGNAEETATQANVVSAASEEVSKNVAAVAAGGEQMQSSIREIAKNANPKTLKNGILFVETRHPVWTAELSSRRHSIRKKLNEALGKDLIREIHFRQARL